MRPHIPIVIETLGDLGTTMFLSASCRRCLHARELDIAALVGQFGPGFPLSRIRKRLHCTRCGAWDGEIRLGHSASECLTGDWRVAAPKSQI
jgi:hypothetical protein